ncbi:MAG: ADP-ribosylglycohydrolase family protein [Bacteroidota bacterium]
MPLLLCSLTPLLCTCDRAPKKPNEDLIQLDRGNYQEQLQGFWLGQCIANWTGLITEMDKIGNVGEVQTGDFYTRANWGQPDEPNIWSGEQISTISPTIDFVLLPPDSTWGADDDTDIEYMYQHLLHELETTMLTPEQIRDGWLKHIRPEEENYLWVSNQRAFDLMRQDTLPPLTSDPRYNEHYEMIDAQLTTEIFGLFAPGRPDVALKMAYLPIRTTASGPAAEIAEFYVVMHALAVGKSPSPATIQDLAATARQYLSADGYPAKMYDFVKARYEAGIPWEQCRDEVYQRYQVDQEDGYTITSQNIYCNGCFAAGINFAASLVSLFYGEGDIRETIKIGALCGWDSDNPTATWGGLLGFMLGREGVEAAFGKKLSNTFWIHRTRQGFPNEGRDNFAAMARRGVEVIDRVVTEHYGGRIKEEVWEYLK